MGKTLNDIQENQYWMNRLQKSRTDANPVQAISMHDVSYEFKHGKRQTRPRIDILSIFSEKMLSMAYDKLTKSYWIRYNNFESAIICHANGFWALGQAQDKKSNGKELLRIAMEELQGNKTCLKMDAKKSSLRDEKVYLQQHSQYILCQVRCFVGAFSIADETHLYFTKS